MNSYKMSQYFPPYTEPQIVKIDLDLSNYAAKSDLNSITHVYTSSLALTPHLTALKTKFNRLDIVTLVPVPRGSGAFFNVEGLKYSV